MIKCPIVKYEKSHDFLYPKIIYLELFECNGLFCSYKRMYYIYSSVI